VDKILRKFLTKSLVREGFVRKIVNYVFSIFIIKKLIDNLGIA